MARLPTPGGDNGNWGTILNEYLSQSHKPNGTIKDDAVTSAQIADGSITEFLLDSGIQAKLNANGDWNTLTNKPATIAAGASAAAARVAIGLDDGSGKIPGSLVPAATWNEVAGKPPVLSALYTWSGVEESTDRTGVMDVRTTLQAIIDNAEAGDTVIFPGGKFRLNGELLIDKPLVVRGGGGMFDDFYAVYPGTAGTTLVTSSSTNNGIHITSSGVILEDLAVVCTAATPTTGTGIYVEGHNFRLARCTVAGFYDLVHIDGIFGALDSCIFFDPMRYGLLLGNPSEPDSGDHGISNCVFAMAGRTTIPKAAVRWESGGGIRWTGNKVVGGAWEYCIDIMAAAGMRSGEFMITGGGLSNATKACLRVGQQTADPYSGFGDVIVSGVVFQGNDYWEDPPTGKAIVLGAVSGNSNSLTGVVVTGCTFKGLEPGGIVAYNMHGLIVGPNIWHVGPYTGALITLAGSSSAGSDGGAGLRQIDIHRQTVIANHVSERNVTIVHDKRSKYANDDQLTWDGVIDYRYKLQVFHDATGWKTQYTIEPPDLGGVGWVDVTFTGTDYSVPGYGEVHFSRKIRRSFCKTNGAGGVITIATAGTDEYVSTAAYTPLSELQIIDGGSGKLLVQTRLVTAGGNATWGEIEVNVSGRVQKFSIGAGI